MKLALEWVSISTSEQLLLWFASWPSVVVFFSFSGSRSTDLFLFFSYHPVDGSLHSTSYYPWRVSVGSSEQTELFRAALPCYILSSNPCSLPLFARLFSSPFRDNRETEKWRNRGRERGDESPNALWLHQIRPSCHQELICLNPSHCSAATLWKPGREELAPATVISAARGSARLLLCPEIWEQCSLGEEGIEEEENGSLELLGHSSCYPQKSSRKVNKVLVYMCVGILKNDYYLFNFIIIIFFFGILGILKWTQPLTSYAGCQAMWGEEWVSKRQYIQNSLILQAWVPSAIHWRFPVIISCASLTDHCSVDLHSFCHRLRLTARWLRWASSSRSWLNWQWRLWTNPSYLYTCHP